jgi:hypothetical protein
VQNWSRMRRRKDVYRASWIANAAPTIRRTLRALGRCKKGRKTWHDRQGEQATRRRLASQARTLAAQRKSLQGQVVQAVVAVGTPSITEKLS